MVDSSYDVAIVGAGPAGSTAARELSKMGYSTVLLDRRKEIGIPVQCGELLPTPNEIQNLFPSSKRALQLMRVPSKLVTNSTSHIRLISPRGNSFEFAFGTNILDRMLFDQWLANRAEQAGAELHIRTRLIARPEKTLLQVTGPQGSEILKAKVVVGADGPCSLIARTIGSKYANPSRDMSAAVQYVMDGTTADSSVVEMYFGNRIAPGGYLWAIPRGGGQANVGLGLREGFRDLRIAPRDYLNNAIHRHPRLSSEVKNARIVSRVSAFIPIGGPLERTADSNTVLIGDAAGHVMASNGGGIPTALIGGEIAAESIKNHLELGVPLSAYEASWKKEMGKELNSALSILRIADRVMRSDSLTDQCMRLAGSKYLESMIRCKLPMPVDFASKTLVRILERIE